MATDPSSFDTHEVFNQPPPLADYNLFATDLVLRETVGREGASWANHDLHLAGADYGRSEVFEWGALANRHLPVLQSFDRFGTDGMKSSFIRPGTT